MVQNRRKRTNNIIGSKKTSTNTILKGAVRSADVYVGNCDLKVDEDSLKEYITNELNIEVIHCISLHSTKPRYKDQPPRSKSFKVTLNMNDRDKVLSPEFWPEDIVCRKYRYPLNRINNG